MIVRCQLCLTIDVTDEARLPANLAAALEAAPASSVTFRGASNAATLKPLVEVAQRGGAAALIEGEPELVRSVNADGAHVGWIKDVVPAYRAVRGLLGERYIVGADAGRSRHDAMEIGEAGGDYVAFGIPAHVGDRATAETRQCELVAWWSEIFEPPVVAYDVVDAEHARGLAEAGADFVAVTLPPDVDAKDVRDWIAPFVAAISVAGKAA